MFLQFDCVLRSTMPGGCSNARDRFFRLDFACRFCQIDLAMQDEREPQGSVETLDFPREEGGRLALSLCPLPASSTLRSKLVADIPYGLKDNGLRLPAYKSPACMGEACTGEVST